MLLDAAPPQLLSGQAQSHLEAVQLPSRRVLPMKVSQQERGTALMTHEMNRIGQESR
jgi:hypothetical protein